MKSTQHNSKLADTNKSRLLSATNQPEIMQNKANSNQTKQEHCDIEISNMKQKQNSNKSSFGQRGEPMCVQYSTSTLLEASHSSTVCYLMTGR